MEDRSRALPLLVATIACAIALAGGWLTGRLDVAIAFSAGAAFALAVRLLAVAATPAIHLSADTAEASDGWAEFHRELNRARRFDRPFGIVRYVGVDRGVIAERQVRDRVAASARRIDRTWLDGGDLFMLLPESDAAAVESAVARAQYAAGAPLDTAVTALFPANGITSGALIACLYQADASPVAIGALSPAPAVHGGAASTDADGRDLAETAT